MYFVSTKYQSSQGYAFYAWELYVRSTRRQQDSPTLRRVAQFSVYSLGRKTGLWLLLYYLYLLTTDSAAAEAMDPEPQKTIRSSPMRAHHQAIPLVRNDVKKAQIMYLLLFRGLGGIKHVYPMISVGQNYKV